MGRKPRPDRVGSVTLSIRLTTAEYQTLTAKLDLLGASGPRPTATGVIRWLVRKWIADGKVCD